MTSDKGPNQQHFKANYIEVLKRVVPEFYEETEYRLFGEEEDLQYNVLAKILYTAKSISGLIGAPETIGGDPPSELGLFASSFSSNLNYVPYFVPFNDLTDVTPAKFERNILAPLGKKFADFTNVTEFSSFMLTSGLPLTHFNLVDPSFAGGYSALVDNSVSTIPLAQKRLMDELGMVYFLNTSGRVDDAASVPPSSVLLSSLSEDLFYGKPIQTSDSVKMIFKWLMTNCIGGGSAWTGVAANHLPAPFNSPSSTHSDNFWASGNQLVSSLNTMVDVWVNENDPNSLYFRDIVNASLLGLNVKRMENAGPMGKMLKALAYAFYDVQDTVRDVQFLLDIEECPEEFLEYLGRYLGWTFFTEDPDQWRQQLKEAIYLYKAKGTRQALVNAVNMVIPSSVYNPVDATSGLQELWETYFPNIIYYTIKTETDLATNLESYRTLAQTWNTSLQSSGINITLNNYDPNNPDNNARFLVDYILEYLNYKNNFLDIGSASSYKDTSFWQSQVSANNVPYYYSRGGKLRIPPWEENRFYDNAQLNEPIIRDFSSLLGRNTANVGLGLPTSSCHEIGEFLSSSIGMTEIEPFSEPRFGANNTFKFMTSELKLPFNYHQVIEDGNLEGMSVFDYWNSKSSEVNTKIHLSSIDFSANNYINIDRSKIGRKGIPSIISIFRQFAPFHVLNRIYAGSGLYDWYYGSRNGPEGDANYNKPWSGINDIEIINTIQSDSDQFNSTYRFDAFGLTNGSNVFSGLISPSIYNPKQGRFIPSATRDDDGAYSGGGVYRVQQLSSNQLHEARPQVALVSGNDPYFSRIAVTTETSAAGGNIGDIVLTIADMNPMDTHEYAAHPVGGQLTLTKGTSNSPLTNVELPTRIKLDPALTVGDVAARARGQHHAIVASNFYGDIVIASQAVSGPHTGLTPSSNLIQVAVGVWNETDKNYDFSGNVMVQSPHSLDPTVGGLWNCTYPVVAANGDNGFTVAWMNENIRNASGACVSVCRVDTRDNTGARRWPPMINSHKFYNGTAATIAGYQIDHNLSAHWCPRVDALGFPASGWGFGAKNKCVSASLITYAESTGASSTSTNTFPDGSTGAKQAFKVFGAQINWTGTNAAGTLHNKKPQITAAGNPFKTTFWDGFANMSYPGSVINPNTTLDKWGNVVLSYDSYASKDRAGYVSNNQGIVLVSRWARPDRADKYTAIEEVSAGASWSHPFIKDSSFIDGLPKRRSWTAGSPSSTDLDLVAYQSSYPADSADTSSWGVSKRLNYQVSTGATAWPSPSFRDGPLGPPAGPTPLFDNPVVYARNDFRVIAGAYPAASDSTQTYLLTTNWNAPFSIKGRVNAPRTAGRRRDLKYKFTGWANTRRGLDQPMNTDYFGAASGSLATENRQLWVSGFIPKGFNFSSQQYVSTSGSLSAVYSQYNTSTTPFFEFAASSWFPARAVADFETNASSWNQMRDVFGSQILRALTNIFVRRGKVDDRWLQFSDKGFNNFKFGRGIIQLYQEYNRVFRRNLRNWVQGGVLRKENKYAGGFNILSHVFGPILFNNDFSVKGELLYQLSGTAIKSFARGSVSSTNADWSSVVATVATNDTDFFVNVNGERSRLSDGILQAGAYGSYEPFIDMVETDSGRNYFANNMLLSGIEVVSPPSKALAVWNNEDTLFNIDKTRYDGITLYNRESIASPQDSMRVRFPLNGNANYSYNGTFLFPPLDEFLQNAGLSSIAGWGLGDQNRTPDLFSAEEPHAGRSSLIATFSAYNGSSMNSVTLAASGQGPTYAFVTSGVLGNKNNPALFTVVTQPSKNTPSNLRPLDPNTTYTLSLDASSQANGGTPSIMYAVHNISKNQQWNAFSETWESMLTPLSANMVSAMVSGISEEGKLFPTYTASFTTSSTFEKGDKYQLWITPTNSDDAKTHTAVIRNIKTEVADNPAYLKKWNGVVGNKLFPNQEYEVNVRARVAQISERPSTSRLDENLYMRVVVGPKPFVGNGWEQSFVRTWAYDWPSKTWAEANNNVGSSQWLRIPVSSTSPEGDVFTTQFETKNSRTPIKYYSRSDDTELGRYFVSGGLIHDSNSEYFIEITQDSQGNELLHATTLLDVNLINKNYNMYAEDYSRRDFVDVFDYFDDLNVSKSSRDARDSSGTYLVSGGSRSEFLSWYGGSHSATNGEYGFVENER